MSLITVQCLYCEKQFSTQAYRLKAGRGKYCSRQCLAKATFKGKPRKARTPEHRAKLGACHKGGAPHNKGPRFQVSCSICGTIISVPAYRIRQGIRYCSIQCAHEAKRRITGTDHKLFRRIQMPCEVCGRLAWVKPAKVHEFRFCSRSCQGAWTAKLMAEHNGPTSIEQALMDELDKRHIKYRAQHLIAHWVVDITIPELRIAIEADGDYWHRPSAQQEKDARKTSWLVAHKWSVLHFTGTEILNSASDCIDQVVELMTSQLPG